MKEHVVGLLIIYGVITGILAIATVTFEMLPKTAHLLIGALTLTTRGLRSCQMALTCAGMSRLSLTRLVRHRCAPEGPGINVHVANVACWYPVASYQPPTPPRNKPLLDIPHLRVSLPRTPGVSSRVQCLPLLVWRGRPSWHDQVHLHRVIYRRRNRNDLRRDCRGPRESQSRLHGVHPTPPRGRQLGRLGGGSSRAVASAL